MLNLPDLNAVVEQLGMEAIDAIRPPDVASRAHFIAFLARRGLLRKEIFQDYILASSNDSPAELRKVAVQALESTPAKKIRIAMAPTSARWRMTSRQLELGNRRSFQQSAVMVLDGVTALGRPLAFVYNSHGVMNAFAVRMFGRAYIWITSAIIDADNDAQIRFVIGHELAHHAAGHFGGWRNLIKLPAHLVPLLGVAYSRARELTCDRVGAYLCRDLNAARGALQMLAAGSAKLNGAMNTDAFEAQEPTVPVVAGFLLHIFSSYPRPTRRVIELTDYYTRRSSQSAPVAANPRGRNDCPVRSADRFG